MENIKVYLEDLKGDLKDFTAHLNEAKENDDQSIKDIIENIKWLESEILRVENELNNKDKKLNVYIASCKDDSGNMVLLTKKYFNKSDFKKDISLNGFKLNYGYIFTENEYDKFINDDSDFMNWFNLRLEKRRKNSNKSNLNRKIKNVLNSL